jgi:hypothetical protein
VTFALNGYQQMTVPVRSETPAPTAAGESPGAPRLQPNPVYAELQPMTPARPAKKKKAAAKKRTVAKKQEASPAAQEPAPAPAPTQTTSPDTSGSFPNSYPWPPAPQ